MESLGVPPHHMAVEHMASGVECLGWPWNTWRQAWLVATNSQRQDNEEVVAQNHQARQITLEAIIDLRLCACGNQPDATSVPVTRACTIMERGSAAIATSPVASSVYRSLALYRDGAAVRITAVSGYAPSAKQATPLVSIS